MAKIYKTPCKYKTYTALDSSNHAIRVKEKQALNEQMDNVRSSIKHRNDVLKKDNDYTHRLINERKEREELANQYRNLLEKSVVYTLSGILSEALPLDEDFKESYKAGFDKLIANKLSEKGNIMDVIKHMENSGQFLSEVAKECKEKAKEADDKKRKGKEVEDKELKVENFDTDKAAEIIKEKVIKVIEEENEVSEKQKEISTELENAKTLKENATIYCADKIKSYSLFKGMMMNNYKSAIHKAKDLNESTIYVSLTENEIAVDMDMILAETIINYTLLEMLNTLKYEKFTARGINKMANDLAYQNKF